MIDHEDMFSWYFLHALQHIFIGFDVVVRIWPSWLWVSENNRIAFLTQLIPLSAGWIRFGFNL